MSHQIRKPHTQAWYLCRVLPVWRRLRRWLQFNSLCDGVGVTMYTKFTGEHALHANIASFELQRVTEKFSCFSTVASTRPVVAHLQLRQCRPPPLVIRSYVAGHGLWLTQCLCTAFMIWPTHVLTHFICFVICRAFTDIYPHASTIKSQLWPFRLIRSKETFEVCERQPLHLPTDELWWMWSGMGRFTVVCGWRSRAVVGGILPGAKMLTS